MTTQAKTTNCESAMNVTFIAALNKFNYLVSEWMTYFFKAHDSTTSH